MKEDKTLLQEGTVRRFMKLAGTQPLASDFVNEMGYGKVYKDDEPEEEKEMDVEMDTDVEMDVEEPELEPELEPEGGEGEVTLTDEDVDTLLAALDAANMLADKLRGAAEMAEPEEMEAAELELPAEDDMTGEPLEVEEEEMELEEAQEEDLEEDAHKENPGRDKRKGHHRADHDNEAVVNEVYKRVAQRLSELKGE